MELLTKQEELFLLTIHSLKNDAYLVSIRNSLLTHTGKDWAFGSIYITLGKLLKKGLVQVQIGEPSGVRGGKAIKYYRMTEEGMQALVETKKLQDIMWKNFSVSSDMMKVNNEE